MTKSSTKHRRTTSTARTWNVDHDETSPTGQKLTGCSCQMLCSTLLPESRFSNLLALNWFTTVFGDIDSSFCEIYGSNDKNYVTWCCGMDLKMLILGLSAGMSAVAVSGSTTNTVLHRKEVTPTATKALQRRETGVMTSTTIASTPGNSDFLCIFDSPAFANLVELTVMLSVNPFSF